MHTHFFKLTALLILGIAFWFSPTPQTSAATNGLSITVNDTADVPDANPGDGKCLTKGGTCTLRAAIMEANKHSGTDVIRLQPNATYLLTRAGQDDNARLGDLDVTDSIHLVGNGATVDANGSVTHERAFHFLRNKKHTLISVVEHLTVTGGNTSASGGGIWNQALLLLEGVTVSSNHADASGGGINNDSLLSIRDSTVEKNDCTCSAVGQGGGGIASHSALGLVTSTINNNAAHTDGGGIWAEGVFVSSVASTVTLNIAYRHGGGIYTTASEVRLFQMTIARNFADTDKDGVGEAGGVYKNGGKVVLGHTILGDNFRFQNGALKPDDCRSGFDSDGYNIITMNLNCIVSLSKNYIGFSPGLDSFDNHGGATKTISLKTNSVARDTGNPDGCKFDNGTTLPSDQRAFQRIADANNDGIAVCDIGAYEAQAAPFVVDCSAKPTNLTLDSPDDQATLKGTQAILFFDADCADRYSVIVRRDSKHGPAADKVKNLPAGYYLTATLEKGHTYFWRVAACNAAGCIRSKWFRFALKP